MTNLWTSPLPTALITRIKMLQKQAGIGEDDYRALLLGYGVESCKELMQTDALRLIGFLTKLVEPGKASRKETGKKYDYLGRRLDMATPKQLRMLEAMWKEVSYQPTVAKRNEAWSAFLKNKFDRVSPEHIEIDLVQRIVKTLQVMIYQKQKA
jgi:Protein of unknown function (DUF1018)